MSLLIRFIQEKDLQDIKNILSLYWPEEDLQDRFMSRLTGVVTHDPEVVKTNFVCLVAEDNGAVAGFAGFRKAPEHMLQYATTSNTVEGYILATRPKDIGTGEALVKKALEIMKDTGYTEVVLYSGETHKDSWGFYEHLNFENAGPMTAPNGEAGVVWKMLL